MLEKVTGSAPWAARAGAAVVTKGCFLYLMGGESGFLPTFGPDGQPQFPYCNHVRRSRRRAVGAGH